jgi:hypothetical protein
MEKQIEKKLFDDINTINYLHMKENNNDNINENERERENEILKQKQIDKEKEKENNVKKFFDIYKKLNLELNKNKKLNKNKDNNNNNTLSNLINNKEENQQINHIKKNILLVQSKSKIYIKRKDLLLDIKDLNDQRINSINKFEENEKKSNRKKK